MAGLSLFSPVVVISFLFCFCYCLLGLSVDEESTPPLPTLHYYLFSKPLHLFLRIVRAVLGEAGVKRCMAARHYLLFTNNPVVQIFYGFLIVGGYLLFVFTAYPQLNGSPLSPLHRVGAFLVSISCVICFAVCCTSDPGIIHERNCDLLASVYPYDGLMFTRMDCQTCGTVKPARSKHCALCNHCVARFDHHCVWIGNCVGANNYKLFLLFLLLNSVLCFYGSYLCVCIFWSLTRKLNLWEVTFVDSVTGERMPSSKSLIFSYLTGHHSSLMALLLVCSVFSVVLLCFLTWHLYMALWQNMTTNESFKFRQLLAGVEHAPELHQKYCNILSKHNNGVWSNFKELTDWKGFVGRQQKKEVRLDDAMDVVGRRGERQTKQKENGKNDHKSRKS
eukprot:GHVS01012912.1.p1 GENE.GHVS01012912.1~~GHVS01012912.1.p1  ORF type:complete len:449 (-),score=89.47 GHVS01012912.1:159-1331(-)